jgi:uncharacterized sulfatase
MLKPMPRRPNILILMADQMRADCLGAVNPRIRTPHLDRLEREGALSEHAFSASPVCLPARASLLSGQYPSTHGATWNLSQLADDHPTLLSTRLARAGYWTHLIGKSHFKSCHDPSSPESAPHIHNRRHWAQFRGPWMGFEHADVNIGHTTEKHACGMHYGVWLEQRGIDTARYFGHTDYEAYGTWDLPEEFHPSTWVAETTNRAIDAAAGRDQPFFIWANFQDPHNPCFAPAPWSTMYDPDRIPRFGLKPGEPDCFRDKPPHYREIHDQPGPYRAKTSDPGLGHTGNVCRLPWSDRQTQENAAHYYGMVSLMDDRIGRILAHLDARGLADDTLIVFTADHGDLLGDHGFWWKSLVCYDESIRIPWVARWPRRMPAGQRLGLCNLVDLAPTCAAAAGVPALPQWEGENLLPEWTGGARARHDTLIEERPAEGDFVQHVLVEDEWKLAAYPGRTYGELYHRREDPDHLRNRWGDPACAAVQERMLRRLYHLAATKRRPNPRLREEYAL